MSTVKDQIGKKIRQLRKEKGLTQTAFAELFNISQNRVTNIETGKSDITFEELLAMADYFEVPTDYLLKENSIKNPNPELQYICDYTGLNPKTIEILRHMQVRDYNKPIFSNNNNAFFSSFEEWRFYLKVMERVLTGAPTLKAFSDLTETLVHYNFAKDSEKNSGEFFSDIPYYEEEKDVCLYKIQKSIMKIIENYGIDLFEKEFCNSIMEQRLTETISDADRKDAEEIYNEQKS